jgi:uncharacterized NAD(P)/FAD-binding protein YdhS
MIIAPMKLCEEPAAPAPCKGAVADRNFAGFTGVLMRWVAQVLQKGADVPDGIPLSITVYEANADPGTDTPFHPRANDRAMLANIASIELPPVCESLTVWLRRQSSEELGALGVQPENIGEREFYPPSSLALTSTTSFCQC